MNFTSVGELAELAESEGLPISEVMIQKEMKLMDRTRDEVFRQMEENLVIMEKAVQKGLNEAIHSSSGLSGGDALNAAMGTIVATPTAGACGVLPGCVFTAADRLGADRETMVRALFVSGAIGYCIANNSFISGAAGGCQAEVGSATAMSAAAVVEMAGGFPSQSAEAVAIALKNMLGLVCDPVAGLVEAPCVKRNAMGGAIAMVAADMAMAGVTSVIPADEVIGAMYRIGRDMPTSLKETALGGLAATQTGREWERRIFGKPEK